MNHVICNLLHWKRKEKKRKQTKCQVSSLNSKLTWESGKEKRKNESYSRVYFSKNNNKQENKT